MTRNKSIYEEITGVPEDATSRLMREMRDSPAEQLRREMEGLTSRHLVADDTVTAAMKSVLSFEESAGAKYLREMQDTVLNDPIHRRYEKQIAEAKAMLLGDPNTLKLEKQLAEARALFASDPATLALEKQMADAKANVLANFDYNGLAEQAAVAKIKAAQFTTGGLIEDATMAEYRKLLAIGVVGGSIADTYQDVAARHGLIGDDVLSSLTGNLSAIARTNQWASVLGDTSASNIAKLYPGGAIGGEVDRIRDTVLGYARETDALERARLSTTLGLFHQLDHDMETTKLKLAAFAGAGEVLGFQALTSDSAYHELFGRWSTRLDLPAQFWRDPKKRRRMYNEAEVDPGLIESDPQEVIEVAVESGFVAGVADADRAVALFDIGGISMRLRSSDIGVDAFRALVWFEQALRLFIATKLETVTGPNWAKQRIDGEVHAKAKRNRAAALAGGETETAILAYVDLGELIGILLRKDNWDQVFGHVFPNRQRLEFDLQALVATRRPTMHARKVDAVRLLELMCIMRRLNQFMTSDGGWKLIADSDD
jgi:hypothetical protein